MSAPPDGLISVVIPARNEAASLPRVVADVRAALAPWPHEVVIVDDGSTDDEWSVVRELNRVDPNVRAVRLARNFGHQAALLAGLVAARGAAVITMDADGQHPAALLPTLVERWRAGAAVVQAVRRTTTASPLKRAASAAFYRVYSALAGVPIRGGAPDFRLLGRPVVAAALRSAGPMPFLRGLIPWLGFGTVHVEYDEAPRAAGAASYTWRRSLRLALDGLLGSSIMPLRLSTYLGLSVCVASLAYFVFVLVAALEGRTVPGWASSTGLLALLGGIQLLALGILGEYVGRLFVASLDRPRFIVSEALGLADEVRDG